MSAEVLKALIHAHIRKEYTTPLERVDAYIEIIKYLKGEVIKELVNAQDYIKKRVNEIIGGEIE